ncbi:hypothetical protein L1987_53893 [Smallanthus sonchifolius]|uniref:Uncharacterized protein n=1 Tax=Smallanthus sonchifolius TaxID=185202 RepID=A0ACB9EWL4_9ASTR|nr:hypothetical protein L1987_53893 [Smallanthus sonchifolius]
MSASSDKASMIPSSKDDATMTKKRKKPTSSHVDEDGDYMPVEESKGAIKRIWSKNDEIKILEALKKQTNKSDMKTLFDTTNKCLDFSVSKRQLGDKVRKLKKKFLDSIGKTVVHLDRVYELSKQLWGDGDADEDRDRDGDGDADGDGDRDDAVDDETLFRDNYPNLDLFLKRMYSNVNLGVWGFKMIRSSILRSSSLSATELDEMEVEWEEHNLADIERRNNEMKLTKKHWMRIENATSGSKSNK